MSSKRFLLADLGGIGSNYVGLFDKFGFFCDLQLSRLPIAIKLEPRLMALDHNRNQTQLNHSLQINSYLPLSACKLKKGCFCLVHLRVKHLQIPNYFSTHSTVFGGSGSVAQETQYAYESTSAFTVSVIGNSTPTKETMALDLDMDFLELKLRLQLRRRSEGWKPKFYRVTIPYGVVILYLVHFQLNMSYLVLWGVSNAALASGVFLVAHFLGITWTYTTFLFILIGKGRILFQN